MPCIFKLRPKRNPAEVYEIALGEIRKFGAKYTGDSNGGKFEIEILKMTSKGKVSATDKVIIVEVTEKPLLIPCSLIETSIKNYFSCLL